MYQPRLGDYGVVKTKGFFGKLIRIGTQSRWNHCFIYIGNDLIVEANPTGVAVSPVTKYPLIAWNQHEVLSYEDRETIASHAKWLVGRPYSFFTIAGMALRILGFKFFSDRLLAAIAKHDGYICSELVAECYRTSGNVVVNEKDYLVNPGDLAERLIYQ
jgi:uncharacterized protein YycO